jgi:hypothetical protein
LAWCLRWVSEWLLLTQGLLIAAEEEMLLEDWVRIDEGASVLLPLSDGRSLASSLTLGLLTTTTPA